MSMISNPFSVLNDESAEDISPAPKQVAKPSAQKTAKIPLKETNQKVVENILYVKNPPPPYTPLHIGMPLYSWNLLSLFNILISNNKYREQENQYKRKQATEILKKMAHSKKSQNTRMVMPSTTIKSLTNKKRTIASPTTLPREAKRRNLLEKLAGVTNWKLNWNPLKVLLSLPMTKKGISWPFRYVLNLT